MPQAPSRSVNHFQHNLLFLRKFLQHGTKIASIWPSSRSLARATCRQVNWETAKVIVELGAGTGPITDVIIGKLRPQTRFLAIERDADFAAILRERFSGLPNVEIIQGDVRELDAILKARHITKVDYFLSGLATFNLPTGVRKRMLVGVRRHLTPQGVFSNITEVPLIYWRNYKALFKHVDFQFVPVNMPPGGVYHCRAARGGEG